MTAAVASGVWSSPVLDGAESSAAWAGATLASSGFSGEALAVATLDAGASEAVDFWRDALETGFAFANPRAFPWTLANSPAGRIAQELDVRGPTFTLVGRSGALAAALDHALELVDAGTVDRVVVAALDRGAGKTARLAAVAFARPNRGAKAPLVFRSDPPDRDDHVDAPTPSAALALVLARLDMRRDAVVGGDGESWFRFRPR